MKIVAVGTATAAATIGVVVWARWLARRRQVWRTRLTDDIPINSKFWRDRRTGGGELLYVAIGDSAAQGIGASRPHRSYVGLLARRITELTGRSVRVVNLGISGATLKIAIDDEVPRLATLTPDILTVCIGANDIANFDEERFGREVSQLVDTLPQHAIIADLPSFYFLPGQRQVRVANRLLRSAAAERGLAVVGLHKRTHRQGLWGITTQFAGDLFHPNDRGYRVWADAFDVEVARRIDIVTAMKNADDPAT